MTNNKAFLKYLKSLRVKEGSKFNLTDFDTDFDEKKITKQEGEEALAKGLVQLSQMQDMLYAENKHSVLIILQAMDTAGKDGAIKHVMTGLNPQGVKVSSFKAPTHLELDHDYFWRHNKELPGKGDIVIFNRSHYENVLVTKVHPEYIMNEQLPGIKTIKDINKKFWEKRYKQINRWEKNLSENGTVILKFFLHLSKDEQKRRLIDRIDNPKKNWKFSVSDLKERALWDKYQKAYEDMIEATSTSYAPWHVLPADDKWYTRLCLGGLIYYEFEKLKLSYPEVSEVQLAELQKAKEVLLSENN
ncbi:MAG: polyphosphate kinase 2 family protein [Bacteroidia bacterium]|nr:polyphosphate kinase 2 family protein [Bacteroidia bacterium]